WYDVVTEFLGSGEWGIHLRGELVYESGLGAHRAICLLLAVVINEQLAGDHPFFGVADDPPAGFHGGEQSVFSHDVAGVGVVGGDRGRDIAQRFMAWVVCRQLVTEATDRKSTRLNSSHVSISY